LFNDKTYFLNFIKICAGRQAGCGFTGDIYFHNIKKQQEMEFYDLTRAELATVHGVKAELDKDISKPSRQAISITR
jgi:hypothetical protein